MRLIDADEFDRALVNHEFTAALNEAADNDRAFEEQTMYYSTQSFRDVMKYRPTINAIPVEWIINKQKCASENDSLDVGIAELLEMWQKEQEAR